MGRKRKARDFEPEALPEPDEVLDKAQDEMADGGAPQEDAAAAQPKKKKKRRRHKTAEKPGDAANNGLRFIVFVGNLPYSATAESIRKHFAAFDPLSVRCLNKPDDATKCRGCAFVEFSKGEHMRTCLDKMHHSTFDDGVSKPRTINVELTAGGGGKSEWRKEKIKQRNQKLQDNRSRKMESEKQSKADKEKQKQKHDEADEGDYVHPSRKKRVPQRP